MTRKLLFLSVCISAVCGAKPSACPQHFAELVVAKPNPSSLRLPSTLIVDGRPVAIREIQDLGSWWNAGPHPVDLPGMNARELTRRIARLTTLDRHTDLAQQVKAWLPYAAEWKAVYDYQVRTNPPPPNVDEATAKGYVRQKDGRYQRLGDKPTRPPKGNFTAVERSALMEMILKKGELLFGFMAS